MRRRRDLAVPRALGSTGGNLRTTVGVQAHVRAAVGSAVGVVLGVVVGRAAWARVADGLSFPLVVRLPPARLTAGVSPMGATGTRRPAMRVPASHILRSE